MPSDSIEMKQGGKTNEEKMISLLLCMSREIMLLAECGKKEEVKEDTTKEATTEKSGNTLNVFTADDQFSMMMDKLVATHFKPLHQKEK